MDDLTAVRQIITLEWTARDTLDGMTYQGSVRVDTLLVGGGNTAVFLRDAQNRIMHSYRVRTSQVSLARQSAQDIVAATVADIHGDFGARHVASRLEYRLKAVALEHGYDDLCVCSVGSPENYEGPDRDCLLHGERPLEGVK